VKSFKGSASELQSLFKKFKTMIETALNNDSKQFNKMQTTNANTITQNINKIK
jgi:arsenate reductase-like glutaredoxin family protein